MAVTAKYEAVLVILILSTSKAVAVDLLKAQQLSGVGMFWQITDIHWDTRYTLNGDPLNMCHQASHSQGVRKDYDKHTTSDGKNITPKYITRGLASENQVPVDEYDSKMTSKHQELRHKQDIDQENLMSGTVVHKVPATADSSNSTGEFGNYKCDSPWPLVKIALNAMARLQDVPDFILWTGDMAPHVQDPEPHFPIILKTLANVTSELRLRFPASTAILPVLGNHDTFPKDDYPACPADFYMRYLVEGGWNVVLSNEQQHTFLQGGYYTHQTSAGLMVAVLNTNLYYMGNAFGTNETDPCQQLAWLRGHLEEAREAGTKNLLAAHSPPGFFERLPVVPFFNSSYNAAYLRLVEEYGDVIHSQVYGHLHTDTFRLYGGQQGHGSVGFLAPSLTPWQPSSLLGGTAINPSLRLYTFDAESVVDYTQYHINLTLANGVKEWQEPVTPSNNVVVTTDLTSDGAWSPQSRDLKSVLDNNKDFTFEQPLINEHCRLSDDPDFCEQQLLEKGSEATTVTAITNMRSLQSVVASPSEPQWVVYYKASSAYSLSRLDYASLSSLHDRLGTDLDLFAQYYARNSAGFDNGPCPAICRRMQLCAVQFSEVRDLFQCMGYNKTYFTDLLNKNFKRYNAEDYYAYLEYSSAGNTVYDGHSAVTAIGSSGVDAHVEEANTANVMQKPSVIPSNVAIDGQSPEVPIAPISASFPPILSPSLPPLPPLSNTTNPHLSPGSGGSPNSVGFGVSLLLLAGCVGLVWLGLGLLYAAVRWRGGRGRGAGLLKEGHHHRHGYTPLHDSDQQVDI